MSIGPLGHLLKRRQFIVGAAAAAASVALEQRFARADTGAASTVRTKTNLRTKDGAVDWSAVRSKFILPPDMVYMNSGSEGSMPGFVLDNLSLYSAQWARSPSYSYFSDPQLGETQTENRTRAGRFVGAKWENICLTNNTTMGLAMATMGINFKPGDEILTTDQEHYSLLSPLNVLSKRWGVRVRQLAIPIPSRSPQQITDIFAAAITPKTKAFCFSHVTWTNGLRLPVVDICALARKHRILTVIDAAQAPGVVNLNLPAMGCDYYACPGHKWLSGPPGTGVLYFRDPKSNPQNLWPIISEDSIVMEQYPISTVLQIRGCNNTPSFQAMCDVMDFERSIGKQTIEEHLIAMSAQVKKMAIQRWGEACLFTPTDPAMSSGIAAFVPSSDPSKRFDANFINATVAALQKRKIWARATFFPDSALGAGKTIYTVRVSTNIFNDQTQINALFSALDEITSH